MEWDRSKMLEWFRWLAMLVIASQLFVATVSAQDSTPVAPAIEVVAPEATATPTEAPVEPSPTPEEPTAPAAETPTPIPTEPAPTATAEPTPAPTLDYALALEPDCRVADDQPVELASGGAIDYRCVSRVAINSSGIAPAGIMVTWTLSAIVTPGWSVQLLPPASTPDETPLWTEFDGVETRSVFEQSASVSDAAAVDAFSGEAALEFRVRVNRPACLGGAPVVELRHVATVTAPEISGADLGAGTALQPLMITPVLAPLTAPDIAFDGPLNFGTIEATARGLSETQLDGELNLTVSGLDQACGSFTLQLSATPIVDENGDPREGFALLIDTCDLSEGCIALQLEAGPDAPPIANYTVIVTLQTPQYAALGALGTTIDATLIASANSN